MLTIDINYTRLAKAVLDDNIAAFEEMARGKLAENLLWCRRQAEKLGESFDKTSLLFLTLKYKDKLFIVRQTPEVFLIDTATLVEVPMRDGRKVVYPKADSDEE